MTKDEELEDLRRWKRTIEGLAGDKTEYVLATINAELRADVAELLALVIQYRDDLIHPVKDLTSLVRRQDAINVVLAKHQDTDLAPW